MIRTSVALLPLMLVAAPAFAQSHTGHTPPAQAQTAPLPPGCVRSGAPDADSTRAGRPGAPVCPVGSVPARLVPARDPHAGHDMSTMGQAPATPAMPAGHDMSTMGQMPSGHDMQGMTMPPDVPTSANNPGRPPETPPPARASSGPAHAADLLFGSAEMEASREELRVENGDILTTAVIVERLEGTFADGGEGYAWDAQGWSGGDINRFW